MSGFATGKPQTRRRSLRQILRVYTQKYIGWLWGGNGAVVEPVLKLLFCRNELEEKRCPGFGPVYLFLVSLAICKITVCIFKDRLPSLV